MTWPILSALPAVPAEVLGRDVYSITQGTGPYSINDSLAQNLTAQPWTETVSPEIFSLGTLGDLAVVVRGVDPAAFLSLEDAAWTPPASWPQAWSLAGSRLAARSGRAVGDELTLVGSAIPRLGVVPLLGTFRAGSAADDELLVDYATARFLSGVGAGLYHAIRVKTSDPAALLAFLAQRGASTHVSGPGGVEGGTNTNPLPTDPRVINLFLRYGLGPLPGDYVTEGIAEATDSVQVVAWGLQILVLLLVALGLHAVQARAFADRRATVGILRALGAPGRWVRFRALREVVPLAAVAAAVGGTLGLVAATVLPSSAAILAFGHEVRVEFDPVGLGFVILAVVGVTAVSELALIGAALNERPTESIRGEPALASSRSLEVVLRD